MRREGAPHGMKIVSILHERAGKPAQAGRCLHPGVSRVVKHVPGIEDADSIGFLQKGFHQLGSYRSPVFATRK